jgi:hypothetical protein
LGIGKTRRGVKMYGIIEIIENDYYAVIDKDNKFKTFKEKEEAHDYIANNIPFETKIIKLGD